MRSSAGSRIGGSSIGPIPPSAKPARSIVTTVGAASTSTTLMVISSRSSLAPTGAAPQQTDSGRCTRVKLLDARGETHEQLARDRGRAVEERKKVASLENRDFE